MENIIINQDNLEEKLYQFKRSVIDNDVELAYSLCKAFIACNYYAPMKEAYRELSFFCENTEAFEKVHAYARIGW